MTKKRIFAFLIIIFAVLIGLILFLMLWRNSVPSQSQSIEVATISNIQPNQVSNINSKPVSDKKFESAAKLQAKADALLPLFNNMTSAPVFIKDEPILKSGSETQKGVAYAICENKQPTIFVKKIFYQKANQNQLVNILKHELVHAWFCRQGIKAEHDERFRKKFKSIGGFGN